MPQTPVLMTSCSDQIGGDDEGNQREILPDIFQQQSNGATIHGVREGPSLGGSGRGQKSRWILVGGKYHTSDATLSRSGGIKHQVAKYIISGNMAVG
jgi:hypothetical protein